jgi:curved DNA-binding protein CbpA
MSDETYYTVLNVKETASPSEIKTAYRDLIKQVHPDTITNLAPYLRRIAEDKAKEITEAYTVLSSSKSAESMTDS